MEIYANTIVSIVTMIGIGLVLIWLLRQLHARITFLLNNLDELWGRVLRIEKILLAKYGSLPDDPPKNRPDAE